MKFFAIPVFILICSLYVTSADADTKKRISRATVTEGIFLSCESRVPASQLRPILDSIEDRYERFIRQQEGPDVQIRATASARLLSSTKKVISYSTDELLKGINFDGTSSLNSFQGTVVPFQELPNICEYKYQITVRIRSSLAIAGDTGSVSNTVSESGMISILIPTTRRINF